MPLDKNGQPYTPLTDKDLARMRAIPYPPEFGRASEMIERFQAAQAAKRKKKEDEQDA